MITFINNTDFSSDDLNQNFQDLSDGSGIDSGAIVDRHISKASGWINLTYQNSWATYSGTWGTAAYRKDTNGIVYLRGLVKNGSSTSAVVATLPAGYRPAVRTVFSVSAYDDLEARVDITTAGEITPVSIPSTLWLSLNGICFYAEG